MLMLNGTQHIKVNGDKLVTILLLLVLTPVPGDLHLLL